MPDLSEGVLGAAIMLCWWELMRAKSRGRSVLFAALTGAGVFVIEANRVTGVFIVPVMLLCTLVFFRRRFGWLVLAGAFAALLYLGECFFYKRLFDDWLHDLTANLKNKEAKGTEFPNPWALPFRFLDTLWKGNPLAPFYCVAALVGIGHAWRRCGVLWRVVVLWFVALYLTYACAPQSLWPVRPLVRDADRFLAALAVPMSVLAAVGLWRLAAWLWARFANARWANRLARFERQRFAPIWLGVGVVALLAVMSTREIFDIGFVPEMRRYLAALPDGTKVFSHKPMREIVHLVAARDARRLEWFAPNEILHANPRLEAMAAQCSEFWYARKLVWLNTRKELEKAERAKEIVSQPALGSYFDEPEKDWRLAALFAKGDTPDLVFHQRRAGGSPPARVLSRDAAEWQQLIPPLPADWTPAAGKSAIQREWSVPADLRGRLVRFDFDAASPQVEACTIRLRFTASAGRKLRAEYLLKPYLWSGGGREFFALPIPTDADACQVQLRFAKSAKRVEFTSFRAVVEPTRQGRTFD
jgi:hypothetical protein